MKEYNINYDEMSFEEKIKLKSIKIEAFNGKPVSPESKVKNIF